MQRINIVIGQTWKRQTKVHILSHFPFPIFHSPFLEQPCLSHSFIPFWKISNQPPPFWPLAKIFNPHLQKRGTGGWVYRLWVSSSLHVYVVCAFLELQLFSKTCSKETNNVNTTIVTKTLREIIINWNKIWNKL